MRSYERIGNRLLSRNGGNLSAALYALKKGDEQEKTALSRILGWIRQLPEEPYKDFGFVTTELNDVIFGLKETRQGPLLDARVLSDGTLRCLALLTALETVEQGSRIIVEEFDNGLHPSRVGVLTQAIWDCAHRRQLDILVTTHNPATLDALTEEQLAGVVLCFWDKKQKTSRLLPLFELPRADILLERGHLGDLVTSRIIEQHLTPGFEEHRKQKAADWLKALP
jgi:predicted ATPase